VPCSFVTARCIVNFLYCTYLVIKCCFIYSPLTPLVSTPDIRHSVYMHGICSVPIEINEMQWE